MLTENSSAFAFLISQMAEKIPQDELPSLVSNSVDAMDEFLLVSASLNRIAYYTNFEDLPDGARMLSTVNCAISDLGYAIGELNRLWETAESIQASKQRALQTTHPKQGKCSAPEEVTNSDGGDK